MSFSPTPTTSTSSQSKNPISLRLNRLPNTNFDDYATREGFVTVPELYGHTDEEGNAASNAKADEVNDDSSLAEHAANARRDLRRDMEKKLAESSGHFVQALGEVDQVRTRSWSLFHLHIQNVNGEISRISNNDILRCSNYRHFA